MGLFEFLLFAVVVVLAVAATVWIINYMSPDHPKVIDKGFWALAVVMILWALASAIGLFGHDPQIPRIR
jgi:hypothetical protein